MQHTITHSANLALSVQLVIPAVTALLALTLCPGLLRAIFALAALPLVPFVMVGAALGYLADTRPRGLRLAAAVAMAAMVGGCVPSHVGSVHAVSQAPTTAQCASEPGALAYPQGCDDAMTAACGELAREHGVRAHENPLDELGAECITDVPAEGCSMMGDGGSAWVGPSGMGYCSTAIAWVDLGLR